jgi:hypothetical protein
LVIGPNEKISISWGKIPGVSNLISFTFGQDENSLYNIEDWDLFESDQDILEGTIEKYRLTEESIENLKLELGGCMVSIVDSEDGFIYLEGNHIGKLQAYTQENTLYVLSLTTNLITNLFASDTSPNGSANITLYLPADKRFQEMDLKIGATDARLNQLKANSVNIELGAGEFQVDQIDCSDLDIEVGAGKFSAGTIHCNALVSKVGAGSLEVESADIQGNMDLDVNAGKLSMTLLGTQEDYTYDVNCTLGTTKIGNTKYGSFENEDIDNNSTWTVEIDVNLGSVDIRFDNP